MIDGNAALLRPPSSMPALDSDEVRAAVAEAMRSEELQYAIEVLTAPDEPVRGCMVSSDRARLQALQEVVRWTIGGYDTRPTQASTERKNSDRLNILLTYKQPLAKEGSPPTVAMYDYLCHTLFQVPVKPVGPEVVAPMFRGTSGELVQPEWIECDWSACKYSERHRPDPALVPNRYPYQLPVVDGEQAEHWVLWYLHFPFEPLADPPDDVIAADLLKCLTVEAAKLGVTRFDYIWYRNPAMSVPDVFHVQAFVIFRGRSQRREAKALTPAELRAKRLERFEVAC